MSLVQDNTPVHDRVRLLNKLLGDKSYFRHHAEDTLIHTDFSYYACDKDNEAWAEIGYAYRDANDTGHVGSHTIDLITDEQKHVYRMHCAVLFNDAFNEGADFYHTTQNNDLD